MLKKEQWLYVTVCCVAILFVLFALIPPPNRTGDRIPPRAEPHQNSAEAPRNGQDSRPGLIEKPILQIETEGEHRNEREKGDKPWIYKVITWIYKVIDDPNALFALGVFLAACAQVWVGNQQWKAVRDANQIAKNAADAARNSATAAIGQAKIIQGTERPYVLIGKITPRLRDIQEQGPPKVREFPDADCVIKNYGRTPARLKKICLQLRLSKDETGITLSPVRDILQIRVLGPGGSYEIQRVPMGDVLEGRHELVERSQVSFWLHFDFVYLDMSGECHETRGKWRYNFLGDAWEGDYEKIS